MNEENKILKPEINLKYNGKDCTKDFSKYLVSVSFTDYEDEQSDELTISLDDSDGYFSNQWHPKKGDKIEGGISFGADYFSFGILTIDENELEFSTEGNTIEIKALATSTNFSVRTKKVKNHSGKTLIQIAREIGKSYGFKVVGNQGNIKVGKIVQKNESDIAFLKRISKLYGYIFNIKDGLLTFISSESLENKKALFKIQKTDFNSFRITDSITKNYGKCKASYLDPKSKSVKTYTAIGNTEITDMLTLNTRFNSLKEAKRAAISSLKNGSREVTGTIDLSIPINNFMAGVNFEVSDVGKFSGLWHIKSSKRTVFNSGYKISGEVIKCI